jgi:hypothetical protein
VVGYVVPYRRLPLARAGSSRPFGRVDAYDDRLVPKTWGLPDLLSPPLVIPVTAIGRVVVGVSGGLRIFLTGHKARYVSVAAFGHTRKRLAAWLSERGLMHRVARTRPGAEARRLKGHSGTLVQASGRFGLGRCISSAITGSSRCARLRSGR